MLKSEGKHEINHEKPLQKKRGVLASLKITYFFYDNSIVLTDL
jgi:hypothetical protein